jgi:hypothetical protein
MTAGSRTLRVSGWIGHPTQVVVDDLTHLLTQVILTLCSPGYMLPNE